MALGSDLKNVGGRPERVFDRTVAPVVQADWSDVVALIPAKDAPEPERGWTGFVCKQRGSSETLSRGRRIHGADPRHRGID